MKYDRFSDKDAHSIEWFEITKNFLNLAFALTVMKRSARSIGVGIEGCCPSMRCLVTLLRTRIYVKLTGVTLAWRGVGIHC
jgi:hypothetical protein